MDSQLSEEQNIFEQVDHQQQHQNGLKENKKNISTNMQAVNASKAFEEILHTCGDYNLYQWSLMVISSSCSIFTAFHNMGAVYLAATPNYVCNIPYLKNESKEVYQKFLNQSVPWVRNKDGYLENSKCLHYDYNTFSVNQISQDQNISSSKLFGAETKKETNCHSWFYDHDIYESTIVTEWNLVCNRRWIMSTIQSSYMMGILVGALIFSIISDKMGRRVSSLICCCLLSISSISVAFTHSFVMLLILRFIVAASGQGIFLSNYVILMECLSLRGRTVLGTLFHISYAIGFMGLGFFAYLLRDWRNLQMVISIPTILLLGYYWILPESARWLLMKGRETEGLDVLQSIAKRNKKTFPTQTTNFYLKVISENRKNKPDVRTTDKIKSIFTSMGDLVRTSNMRKRNLIIFYCWFVAAMIYFGLSFSGATLNADVYLAVVLSSAVEIPATFLIIPFLLIIGRKILLSLSFLLGGAALISILFLPAGMVWWNLGLATFGKFCVSMSFPLVFLMSAELMPTRVRNISIGMASVFARLGSGLAPYIVDLLGDIYFAIPSAIFGVLAFVAGGLSLLLPETGNKRLPESIEEVEAMKH